MISDSRIQIVAEGDGEVVFADATKIQHQIRAYGGRDPLRRSLPR